MFLPHAPVIARHHAYLPDGRSTLDLFGRAYVLLNFGADGASAAALVQAAHARRVPLDIVSIPDRHIAGLYERNLVLVRPDGHVAWRADALDRDPVEILDIVRGAAFGAHYREGAASRTCLTADASFCHVAYDVDRRTFGVVYVPYQRDRTPKPSVRVFEQ